MHWRRKCLFWMRSSGLWNNHQLQHLSTVQPHQGAKIQDGGMLIHLGFKVPTDQAVGNSSTMAYLHHNILDQPVAKWMDSVSYMYVTHIIITILLPLFTANLKKHYMWRRLQMFISLLNPELDNNNKSPWIGKCCHVFYCTPHYICTRQYTVTRFS